MKLREELLSNLLTTGEIDSKIEKLLDREIIKEFSMSGDKPWMSWCEFGTHKNVSYWYIVEGGYAVGHNENPGRGWSFPVKKLSLAMIKKCLEHTQTYEQYYNIH